MARYADATNVFAGPSVGPAVGEGQARRPRRALRAGGHRLRRIRKTILWTGPLRPDAEGGKVFAEQMAAYAEVGIEEVHVMPVDDPTGYVGSLGDHVLPLLREL